ncbi:translesion DNA synthesis-associated protein ImuA [Glaciecola siphonariae]|uniref:Translesion DNA synthesis-associated protein ImuA n=1 Tax=Glaciecola siphonariae TaxID=521012 RepID=A0ABV9LYM4_9ALTE
MNPILHELENKQWIWTAARAKQASAQNTRLKTGYQALDSALSGGFPSAGMIHINSHLGCGELRLMLDVLQRQSKAHTDKLWVFIAPPFELNAEFLLSENISLSQLLIVRPDTHEEALWSAEQCAKSGACEGVFLWQNSLQHTQIRKLELAALHGQCHCFWFDNSAQQTSNLPLSLSLSLQRKNDELQVKINKQKVGWAKPAIKIKLPFKCRTGSAFRSKPSQTDNVIHIRAKS